MLGSFFGYIDPGGSSYLFQLLIAGLTTVAFFFAAIKRKLLGLFSKSRKDEDIRRPEPMPLSKAKSETRLIQR